MPQAHIEARELTSPDVQWISLVKRGANRIPFRIVKSDAPSLENQTVTKQEKTMINLSGLRKIIKGEDPTVQPEDSVLAFVIDGSSPEYISEAQKVIKSAGFDFDAHKINEDGTTLIYKSDVGEVEGKIVRLSKSTLVVVKADTLPEMEIEDSVKKGDIDVEEINKAYANTHFYQGFYAALDTLYWRLESAVYQDTKEDFQEKVQQEFSGFMSYIEDLMKTLPVSVLKVDKEIQGIQKSDATESPAQDSNNSDKDSDKENEDDASFPAGATGVGGGDTTGDAASSNGGTLPVEEGKEEKPATDTTQEIIQKSIETLAATVEALNKTVAGMVKKQEEIQDETSSIKEKLESVEGQNTRVAKALTSVVAAPPAKGDAEATSVVKGDDDPRTGIFDTAFMKQK